MTKPPYFVAVTGVFEQVTDSSLWVGVKATTLDGAKRQAVKRARGVTFGVTFTARVGIRNVAGNFDTVAEMVNSAAITRRRAVWRIRQPPGSVQLVPISASGGVKSISDDDLCATCRNCRYKPGETSGCEMNWPGREDADGYVQECTEFKAKMITRKITIVLRGETEAAVEEAFDEATDRLKNGCSSGKDSNDTSGFYFENTEDVPAGEIPA